MAATSCGISCRVRCAWYTTASAFFALLALVYLGGGLLWSLIRPVLRFYLCMLVQILNVTTSFQ